MIAQAHDLVIGRWGARYRNLVLPCAVGRGGVGAKRGEGDGITPIGVWRIAEVRYRADRMPKPDFCAMIRATRPADIWSDDPKDPRYNNGLRLRSHPFSHEALHRPDPLYNLLAVLDFNRPDTKPGAGSAIFLHVWRKPRHPTGGCIAFSPDVLRFILATWTPASRVVIPPV